MKVLSIGTDRKLFEEGSAVRARVIEYGNRMKKLHIIVFSLKKNGFNKKQVSSNVFIYPTNSSSKVFYISDAIKIGKQIIGNWKLEIGNSEDVVISSQDPFECGFVGWRLSKESSLPFQLQVHTDFLSPYFKTGILQNTRIILAKFLLPKADGVRVVSKRIADSIADAGIKLKNFPKILPIRVDSETIEQSLKIDLSSLFPDFKFIVLMASRLTKEKRINDALYAFQKVLKKYPFAGLLIAGDGPEKKRLQKLALKLAISKNVVFLGFRDDVSSFMKSADIFLSTSEYEGYGMSIIEAGLCRCPIISTDVGISGNLLKNGLNALVCEVGDTECFYHEIIKLISGNALREILAGRLESDIRGTIPTKEEYVSQYVKNLESIKREI